MQDVRQDEILDKVRRNISAIEGKLQAQQSQADAQVSSPELPQKHEVSIEMLHMHVLLHLMILPAHPWFAIGGFQSACKHQMILKLAMCKRMLSCCLRATATLAFTMTSLGGLSCQCNALSARQRCVLATINFYWLLLWQCSGIWATFNNCWHSHSHAYACHWMQAVPYPVLPSSAILAFMTGLCCLSPQSQPTHT